MWRRTYLLLVLVRLWFAVSPSYLHPDENFQGPEVIAGMCTCPPPGHAPRHVASLAQSRSPSAPLQQPRSRRARLTPLLPAGQIFSYPVRRTWEFTSDNPIRSVFPLWPVYGLPMLLLRWLWIGNGHDGDIPPIAVFWTLRVLMFLISFVLEDWALHELIPSPRHRRVAVLLVASSYVTWTYQTHTFSNSIETLVVAWSLVLIQRIVDDRVCAPTAPSYLPRRPGQLTSLMQQQSTLTASTILGIVAVFGVFNRITFPAFLLIPGLRLIPHFLHKSVCHTPPSCRGEARS